MIKKHTAVIAAFISLASFTTINASAADNSTALSHSSGYYDNSQLVTVVNYDDETDIYFTTDGSKPGTDSALYDGTPISVSENTVVRITAARILSIPPRLLSKYVPLHHRRPLRAANTAML